MSSISALTLQAAGEEAGLLGLGKPRLLWRCVTLAEALRAQRCPPARQGWAGKHAWQRREAEQKGAHFLQASLQTQAALLEVMLNDTTLPAPLAPSYLLTLAFAGCQALARFQ